MSETETTTEQPTGRASVEEKNSYVPVPRAEPAEPAEPKTYGGEDSEMKRAANDLTRNAPAPEPELMEVKYQATPEPGKRFSVSVEEAARDLSAWHRGEYNKAEAAAANEFAQVVDEVRQGAAGNPLPESQPASEAPQAPQAQPEAIEQPSGLDPDFAALLEKKPQIRAQLPADLSQVEAAKQAYGNTISQLVEYERANFLSTFPELQGLDSRTLPGALQLLQKTNPERAAEIQAHANRAEALFKANQEYRSLEAQQQQQQFQSWALAEDAEFEASVKNENPELIKKAKSEAPEILKSVYGIDPGALAHAYRTNPALRSAAGQKLIYDAVQYQLAKQSATANPVRNVHPVQRPGTARAAGEASYEAIADMKSEFKKSSGLQQLRLGARLINARRSARS